MWVLLVYYYSQTDGFGGSMLIGRRRRCMRVASTQMVVQRDEQQVWGVQLHRLWWQRQQIRVHHGVQADVWTEPLCPGHVSDGVPVRMGQRREWLRDLPVPQSMQGKQYTVLRNVGVFGMLSVDTMSYYRKPSLFPYFLLLSFGGRHTCILVFRYRCDG